MHACSDHFEVLPFLQCQSSKMEDSLTGKAFIIFIVAFQLATVTKCQVTNSTDTVDENIDATKATDTVDKNFDTTTLAGSGADESTSGNCTLKYPPEAVEQFQELLDKIEEAIFVYFKLNFSMEFESDFAYLSDNATDIIDPLTWVWSKGGRGDLLLSSPFDFIHLSFGTLKPGVYCMDLELQASSECFSDATSDAVKLDAIAMTILELTDKANAELDEKPKACRDLEEEEDEDETTRVCIEKQLGPDQFDVVGVYNVPSVSYTILQGSTAFECWTSMEGKSPKSNRVSTQSWLHWLLGAGIILCMFSPLALDFFIRKHPPFSDRHNLNERFMLVTDPIPVGFKYVLFHWKENVSCFHFFRWVILITIFGLIQYTPLLVAFVRDSDGLSKRIAAVHRVGLVDQTKDIVLHIVINMFYFIFSFVLLGIYVNPKTNKLLTRFLRERDLQSEEEDDEKTGNDNVMNAEERHNTNSNDDTEKAEKSNKKSKDNHKKEPNIAYKYFIVISTPEELWTPETRLPNARAFILTMLYRVKMAFDPNLWKFSVSSLWRAITSCCGAPNCSRSVLCGFVFAIIFPFYFVVFLLFLCFNSLPLLYCLTRAFQAGISNDVKIGEIFLSSSILVIAIGWFCKFVGIFTYIVELLGYTFVGFVANAEIVGPICLVVVVFIGYFVSAATGFYDLYCKLFRQVVEVAEEVDQETQEIANYSENEDHRGITADTMKEWLAYGKKLKRARNLPWVKHVKDKKDRGMKKQDAHEYIEMEVAPSEPVAPGAVDVPVEDSPSSNLLSAEDREVLRLVSKPGFGSLVTYNKKGTPAIESKLFWLVVEKYFPLRGQAAAAMVKLATLAVLIALGMTILSIVDGFRDLPATVEFFGSVVIAGVIPLLLVAMRSPEAQECYDEAMKRQLLVDVKHYAVFEEFESMT